MRRFTISDIHGCCKTFKKLVQEQIQLTKADELYLLGDYIDRGPDSKGIFDFIFELQNSGYQVYCLRGNHEAMLLDAIYTKTAEDMWLRNGGIETLRSFGVYKVHDIPSEYIDFIEKLPYYFALEDYLLVHAGFNFGKSDIYEDKISMIWIRNWHQQITPERTKNRVIVHGHTPVRQETTVSQVHEEKWAVDIDAGCAYTQISGLGFLCAYELNENTLIFQPNVEHKPTSES